MSCALGRVHVRDAGGPQQRQPGRRRASRLAACERFPRTCTCGRPHAGINDALDAERLANQSRPVRGASVGQILCDLCLAPGHRLPKTPHASFRHGSCHQSGPPTAVPFLADLNPPAHVAACHWPVPPTRRSASPQIACGNTPCPSDPLPPRPQRPTATPTPSDPPPPRPPRPTATPPQRSTANPSPATHCNPAPSDPPRPATPRPPVITAHPARVA